MDKTRQSGAEACRDLDVPDVNTLVKGATGDVPTIRTECYTINWL